MFVSLTRWNANRFSSLLILLTLSLRHLYSFFQLFLCFLQQRRCFIKRCQREQSIELCIYNGGWHETLSLIPVSCYEMWHFVTPYMKRSKQSEQTPEGAQCGLKSILKCISFLLFNQCYKIERIHYTKIAKEAKIVIDWYHQRHNPHTDLADILMIIFNPEMFESTRYRISQNHINYTWPNNSQDEIWHFKTTSVIEKHHNPFRRMFNKTERFICRKM